MMEPRTPRGRRLLIVLGVGGVVGACADSVEPVVVTSVEVTSPIGGLLDVGGTAQLEATATDHDGEPQPLGPRGHREAHEMAA